MAEAPATPARNESVLTLEDLSNELEAVADWHALGVKLGMEDHKLREIEEQYHDPQRHKHEVLSRWLRKGHNCTWRRVVEVLMLMGEMVVADTIRLKYLSLTTGPQTSPETTSPVVAAVTQRNRMMIGRKWAALVAHTGQVLQDKLDNREINNSQFRLFLGNLYSCEEKMNGDQFLRKLLKPSATISEMLETLTVEGEWGFLNYYLLESIIEEYGDERTREMMEQYKQDLTGYMLVTKIKDHLDAVDIEHPTHRILPIPQEKLFSSLKTKVKGVNITVDSLKYIRNLWKSLQKQFHCQSIYILVLYRIGEGCLEITWRIPSELAAYIIQKSQESVQYFKEQQFVLVSVDVHVYTESEMGVDHEEEDKQLQVPPVKPMEEALLPTRQTFDDTASTVSNDSGVGVEKPLRAPRPHVRQQVFDDTASTTSSDSGIGMEKRKRKTKDINVMPVHEEQPSMSTEEDVKVKDTTSTLMPLQHAEQPSMPAEEDVKRKDMESTIMPLPHDVEQPSMSTEEDVKVKDTTSTLMPLPHVEQPSIPTEGDIKRKHSVSTLVMRWKELEKAPEKMDRGATAVDGNTLYVNPGYSHQVWAYNLKEDKWTKLPDCPQCNAGLAMVNGLLTALGGMTIDGDATSTLVSLTESRSEWTEHFPPMPVKLDWPAVVCTRDNLVVVADRDERVFVMDTTSLRWSSASSLPVSVTYPSLAVCGTELYVLDYMRSVFLSCSLPTLVQFSSAVYSETTDVWRTLANLPECSSTLTTLCGELVAVGGWKPTNTIYQYNPSASTWNKIRQIDEEILTARCKCLIASLPGDKLVVIGGFTGPKTTCNIVEVGCPCRP